MPKLMAQYVSPLGKLLGKLLWEQPSSVPRIYINCPLNIVCTGKTVDHLESYLGEPLGKPLGKPLRIAIYESTGESRSGRILPHHIWSNT